MRATATEIVRHWSSYLIKVQQGQTVEIMKSGRPVARLTPSPGCMTGKEYAAILRGHKPDPKTAEEVQRILKKQDEHERAIFDRH